MAAVGRDDVDVRDDFGNCRRDVSDLHVVDTSREDTDRRNPADSDCHYGRYATVVGCCD